MAQGVKYYFIRIGRFVGMELIEQVMFGKTRIHDLSQLFFELTIAAINKNQLHPRIRFVKLIDPANS